MAKMQSALAAITMASFMSAEALPAIHSHTAVKQKRPRSSAKNAKRARRVNRKKWK